MVNVCITVGIEENASSLKTLSLRSYHRLSRDILSYYRLGASRFKRNDLRLRTRVFSKLGEKQRNRVQPLLHLVSKNIVAEAKTKQFEIVMEKLTGMRRLYRKGNFQGRKYRARMNSWSYRELQRQIEYKARWEGVKVFYVPARNTSKRCSVCGYKTLESTKRQLWCPRCGTILDRDENAARNIAAGGLRFGPNGPPGEAMVEEREQENATPILKVDGGKLSQSTDDEDLTEPQNPYLNIQPVSRDQNKRSRSASGIRISRENRRSFSSISR